MINDDVVMTTFDCPACGQKIPPNVEWCICGCANQHFDGVEVDHIVNTYSAVARFVILLSNFVLSTDEQLVCRAIHDCIEGYYSMLNDRKNLPSQTYLLYKVFELAKIYRHLPAITLPNQKTVIELDRVFKRCCTYYGWEYRPTTRSAYRTHPILINGEIREIMIQ